MPVLRAAHLRVGAHALPFPLNEPSTSLWYNARAAIWQGLRALGIEAGQRVLAPAYSCGSEIDTLVRAGLEVDCYRVGIDLTADLDDIERLCRRPAAAILVTHFYGFAQPLGPIVALARQHGLRVIEDVSHGLGSSSPDGRPLGSEGDMAVFSLWKSLAIPDGGVLRLRDPSTGHHDRIEPVMRPGWRSRAGRLRHMAEESVLAPHPRLARFVRRGITDPLVGWLQRRGGPAVRAASGESDSSDSEPPEWAQVAFRSERRAWGMTGLSRWLLPRVMGSDMVARRRANFVSLVQQLRPGAGVQLLFDALPAHCCPLFLPLVVEDPRPFCRHLAAHDIGFFRAWCILHRHVDWANFPLEARLKVHGVVLPVHQDLGPEHIERVAAAVNVWTDSVRRTGGA